jgi:hypothetical protein
MLNYFITLLCTIETAINIEEEYETGEYPIKYSIRDVYDRAQAVLDRVFDPFWGFQRLSEGDKNAFHQLFDELMERESVCAHDHYGKHRCGAPTLAPEMEEYVLPF